MNILKWPFGLVSLVVMLLQCSVVWASYAFYVGKNLTEDGVVLVGGTGEETSSHWLEVVPAREHLPGATILVGATGESRIPGELIEIPQAERTYRYISMFYTQYAGFPSPLSNGGVNQHQVAVRDVWAPNRPDLTKMTPTPQKGLNYSDLAKIVLERATTAREGVELIGELIDDYGYVTYGGNSHLIADPNEGWVVWEMSGGKGLWAAERLGPDDVRVWYPGYIEDFPRAYKDNPDFMGSDNIIEFAIEQGWYDPSSGEPFNVFKAYGQRIANETARDGGIKYMSQAALENATRDMAPVSEQDLMARVRDYRIADDGAGYGQVVSLKEGRDSDLVRIWNAPTGSLAAPFVPWWLGVQRVPLEFGIHRYRTKGSSSTFLNKDFQIQEASDFAGRRFKQVMYYMCERPDLYLPIVTEVLEGFELESKSQIPIIESSAKALILNGKRNDAQQLLTMYSTSRANAAMQLGEAMVKWLRFSAELTIGRRYPTTAGPAISQGGELVHCLGDVNPNNPRISQ